MRLPDHKTKIICTIGPASDRLETLVAMISAGMNVARLNFSHGDFSGHAETIKKIRLASQKAERRVAILADLPGPKMRLGNFVREPIRLEAGQEFVLTSKPVSGNERIASVSLPDLPRLVRPGDMIYLADGMVQLRVEKIQGEEIVCRVMVGGELRSRKGINVPGLDLGLQAFTTRDQEVLEFALRHGVEAVSQSFVGRAQDVLAVREAAHRLGFDPFVIAKIERASALKRLDEIIEAADGIMIARGDLGVEIPIEEMAVVQKLIIQKTLRAGKPVITATQMLESMTKNRRPTRAEATDVANAILDGTDAVMLSEESATGLYPVEATEMLAKIAKVTEPYLAPERFLAVSEAEETIKPVDLIARSLNLMVKNLSVAAVFCPTESGTTARRVARFRFPCWTVAISNSFKTCQELLFSFGVWPLYQEEKTVLQGEKIRELVQDLELKGEVALLIEGPSQTHPEVDHKLEIVTLERGKE